MTKQLRKYTGSYLYQQKRIPFSVWVHLDTERAPDTVLFLGAGQVRKIVKWTAQEAPVGTVVVPGVPSWLSDPGGAGLLEFVTEYIRATFKFIRDTFGQTAMHVAAESQAVPGALLLANAEPKTVKNVALALPMGLSVDFLGTNDAARYAEFRRRILARTGKRTLQSLRNLYVGAALGLIVAKGARKGAFKTHYTIGVSYDATNELRRFWQSCAKTGRHLTILLGADDELFPVGEIQESLKRAGLSDIPTCIFPGIAHTSLALRANKALLAKTVESVRRPAK